MRRHQWLLLALYLADGSLSPVQLQKALFLMGKRVDPVKADLTRDEYYNFEPYLYGPFDTKVYDDTIRLALEKQAAIVRHPWNSWDEYLITPQGIKEAEGIESSVDPEAVRYIKELVNWVRTQSFSDLVRSIYAAYPEYAVNSIVGK